jgi:hypothetical protein
VDPFDLTRVTPTVATRSISFENPTGARGSGGAAGGGRKGSPYRIVAPGERVVLADIQGPGTVRHLWMTFPPETPEAMRAKLIEVFYDGAAEPSVSVPAVDFFGVPWGRPVPVSTALTAINEGRGFNSYVPLPFRRSVRIEWVNGAERPAYLYFQADYTLDPDMPASAGYLHAVFRRENPTTLRRDFVIADDLRGPGRFLGCVVGVRVLGGGVWYGEGEVKVYLDGDGDLPTICGTGLEDYVGSAWGMGPHQTFYAGAPLEVRDPARPTGSPDFVGFYRWHVPDPIMFDTGLRVTIQQIGYEPDSGLVERVDDYCAVAFVMCAEPQAVPRADVATVVADIGRLPYE